MKYRWNLRTSPGNRRESASHHIILARCLHLASFNFDDLSENHFDVKIEALGKNLLELY